MKKKLIELSNIAINETSYDNLDSLIQMNYVFEIEDQKGIITYELNDKLEDWQLQEVVEIASGKYYHYWDDEGNYIGFETCEYDKYKKIKGDK